MQTITTDETLILPEGDFGAYLFDMDGTVADSMPLHYETWTQAVEEQGGTFPVELFFAWGGLTLPKTVENLNEKFGYTMHPEQTALRKEELYLKRVGEVGPVASVLAHIEAQQGKIPFAIVSGSPRPTIEATLKRLGLDGRFAAIVGAEDYKHGKPNPEPFLVAAARLGVPPARCLVFEDADAGIASAEAAGMQWTRVPHARIEPVARYNR